jgi:transposase InsO family protein
MDTKITIEALNKAYRKQKPDNDLIIHSDRVCQYILKLYRKIVKKLGLLQFQSFSSKGNPYDNAAIESFHAILKKEELHHRKYRDFKEASISIFQFIEGRYNRNIIHSSINYMTPDEFEQKTLSNH